MIQPECPIVRRAAGLTVEIRRAMHRLEKTLAVCRACLRRDDCEVADRVQDWAERTMQEVSDELGG